MSETELPSETNYVPMADPIATEPEKKREYSSDIDGVEKAAKDLDKARAEGRVPQAESEPVDRGYKYLTGDRAGEPVEENQTLTAERAARDLQTVRNWEAAAEQPAPAEAAAPVDALRAQATQQPQTEPQPQPQPDQAQPVDGVDPEIAQALQNPKIRAALEAEVNAAENARQQFAQQARAAAQLSAASLFSFAPELASLTTEQFPHAMAAIAKVNPARAAEIQAQLQRTESLYKASQQAEAQRAATQQQQLKAWTDQQDAIFEREVASKETPARMQEITQNVLELAEEYGVSREELISAWKSQPIMRSSAMQRVFVDAARYRMAQKNLATHRSNPVPPVQRPGVSQPRNSTDSIDSALKQFRSDASVDNAVKLLMARRAANSR
jgi:hypothetical protein